MAAGDRGGFRFGYRGELYDWFDVSCVAGAATSQLPAFLFRPDYLGDWQLDDAAGHDVAGVSNDPFGAAAWRCELRGTDCFIFAWAVCGCVGGAPESPQAAGRDASGCCGAVACFGSVDADACDYALGDYRADCTAGVDQCVRYAGAAIVPGADGG